MQTFFKPFLDNRFCKLGKLQLFLTSLCHNCINIIVFSIILTGLIQEGYRYYQIQIYLNYWVSCLPVMVPKELMGRKSSINPGYPIINIVMTISVS